MTDQDKRSRGQPTLRAASFMLRAIQSPFGLLEARNLLLAANPIPKSPNPYTMLRG